MYRCILVMLHFGWSIHWLLAICATLWCVCVWCDVGGRSAFVLHLFLLHAQLFRTKWVYYQVDVMFLLLFSLPLLCHRRTAAFLHRFRQFIINRLSLAISRSLVDVVFGFGFAVNALECIDFIPYSVRSSVGCLSAILALSIFGGVVEARRLACAAGAQHVYAKFSFVLSVKFCGYFEFPFAV